MRPPIHHKIITGTVIFIFFLFIGSISLSGQSKGSRERSSFNSGGLEMQLTKQELTPSGKEAFEARIPQKLHDFADHIAILSDPARDNELRERSRTRALELFFDEGRKVQGFPGFEGTEDLSSLLEAMMADGSEGSPLQVEVKEVETKPFEKKEDGLHVADLQALMMVKRDEGEKEARFRGKAYLKKVSKRFGNEKKEVWEVYLGDLEEK